VPKIRINGLKFALSPMSMKYAAYQAHADWMRPLQVFAGTAAGTLAHPMQSAFEWMMPHRMLTAACAVIDLVRLTHQRPAFGIESVVFGDRQLKVREEVVMRTAFGTLLRFRKAGAPAGQPRVLMVAPMSGHFATLLRETVRTMLPEHDVYITDWHNARDVPVAAGRFGFDEYVEHIIRFLEQIGPGAHLMAICQPCVAGLAAVALMSEDQNPATPNSLTLMAGPIDCRISPTKVNALACERSIDWFERNLIATVPMRYPGTGRRVYPGFVQLSAFMNMNLERHIRAFGQYYQNLVKGDTEKADAARNFYREYFAVADLPAEFYLETVQRVFQRYDLPLGKLRYKGRLVDPRAIKRTALLTVEGEKDDICALGQTLAAQDLCSKLRAYMRTHYVQAGVGHYGVFSGKRWENSIYPLVRDTIHYSQ
jgi:poly(3-hydroxybutyrate) depolymerase